MADREFCKKVSRSVSLLIRADSQLRAQEIELRDRNTVLRASNGGKINVSSVPSQALRLM